MAHIDYYTFPLSPYAYLAGGRLEEVAAKHGATIAYKPFALMAIFEETGTPPPPKRHPSLMTYRAQELTRISKKLGMPFNLKPAHWPTNPAPACNAIIAAQAAGGNVGGLVQSLLKACWAEEKDISQIDVVKACLTEDGFDAALTESDAEASAAVFASNTEDARNAGVFGTPTYVVGEEVFFGQDRIEYLDGHLKG